MNNLSISKNMFRNGSVAGITFLLTTLVAFCVRTVFLHNLGDRYLGLNSVFTSILQALSLTDLGMEAAFSFVLYKHIANNDKRNIIKIVRNFKKIYEIIGLLILGLGLAIIPFLSTIIGDQGKHLENVLTIYLLFLANSVGSYFFTYNRTLLNSDQRSYIIALVSFCVNLVGNSFQILSLIIFKSPVVFALIMLLTTIVSNIIINIQVRKYYPFLFKRFKKDELKIDRETKAILFKNSMGGLSNKIGSMIVFASDNILISMFVNLATVGLYANYTMITNNVSSLINRIVQPMVASIGNMKERKPEKVNDFFAWFNFVIFSIALIVIPQLFILLRPFILWWLGDKFVLSQDITFLIVLNLLLQLFRLPALTFIDAYGLQWIQRWKSIIESSMNILFSFVFLLVFNLGLRGIILGTILSTLLTVSWYEPYIVLKYGINGNMFRYFISYVRGAFGVMLTVLLSWMITRDLTGSGLFFVFELSAFTLVISVIVFIIINIGNSTFQSTIKMMINNILKRNK